MRNHSRSRGCVQYCCQVPKHAPGWAGSSVASAASCPRPTPSFPGLATAHRSSFFVSNVFSGILWYVLPAFLIVANDICAYLAGGWRIGLQEEEGEEQGKGGQGGGWGTCAGTWMIRSGGAGGWGTCRGDMCRSPAVRPAQAGVGRNRRSRWAGWPAGRRQLGFLRTRPRRGTLSLGSPRGSPTTAHETLMGCNHARVNAISFPELPALLP